MRVECACGKITNLADKYAGKKIRCPSCKEVIQVPDESIVEEKAVAATLKSKMLARREPEDDDDEEDHPRPRRKVKKQESFLSQYGLYLGIGGAVLAIVAIVVVIVLTRKTSEPDTTVADKPKDKPVVVPPKKDGVGQPVDKDRPVGDQGKEAPIRQDGWKTITSRDGGFSIDFPPIGHVSEQVDGLADSPLRSFKYYLAVPGVKNCWYQATAYIFTIGDASTPIEAAKTEYTRASGRTVVRESEVTVKGNRGWEIVSKNRDGTTRVRGFVIKNRSYLVTVDNVDKLPEKDVDKFFDSLSFP